MLFKSLIALSLALVATAQPLQARDLVRANLNKQSQETTDVYKLVWDIKDIDDRCKKLNSTLDGYKGDWQTEAAVAQSIHGLHWANRKGFHDAKSRRTAFNSADSKSLVQFTGQSIGKTIPSILENLKSKKSVLKGQEGTIVNGLKLMKWDFDSFAGQLKAKISDDQAAGAGTIQKIDNSLQSAIDYFSGDSAKSSGGWGGKGEDRWNGRKSEGKKGH